MTMIIVMMIIVKEKGCSVCVRVQGVEAVKVDLSEWNHRATDLQKSTSQIKSANPQNLDLKDPASKINTSAESNKVYKYLMANAVTCLLPSELGLLFVCMTLHT